MNTTTNNTGGLPDAIARLFAGHDLFSAIISLALMLIIFLILREFFCWYWKVNRTIELLEKLVRELAKSNSQEITIKRKD